MESVVVLSNHLRRMLDAHDGGKPSRATLSKVFAAYQKEREPRMKEIMDFSGLITRLQAWDSILLKFLANWIIPYQPDVKIADQLGDIVKKAPKLEFTELENFEVGRVKWEDENIVMVKKVPVKDGSASTSTFMQFFGGMTALLSLLYVMNCFPSLYFS